MPGQNYRKVEVFVKSRKQLLPVLRGRAERREEELSYGFSVSFQSLLGQRLSGLAAACGAVVLAEYERAESCEKAPRKITIT